LIDEGDGDRDTDDDGHRASLQRHPPPRSQHAADQPDCPEDRDHTDHRPKRVEARGGESGSDHDERAREQRPRRCALPKCGRAEVDAAGGGEHLRDLRRTGQPGPERCR
jgi:hypothetical protein